jgi:hypothetical protein
MQVMHRLPSNRLERLALPEDKQRLLKWHYCTASAHPELSSVEGTDHCWSTITHYYVMKY